MRGPPESPPRRRAPTWLAAAGLLVACGPSEIVVSLPRVPDGVDRLAVLVTDAQGSVISTSGLLQAGEPPPRFEVAVEVDDADIAGAWVVGHGTRSLPSAVRPDVATLSSGLLRVVGPLDRHLGPPQWTARGSRAEDVIAVDTVTDMAPLLDAPWLDRCPILFPSARAWVDISCKEQVCPATAEQAGCALQIDAALCTYGQSIASIDSSGALRLDASSAFGRCDVGGQGPEAGSLTLQCDLQSSRRCPVRFYPMREGPSFALETVQLGPRTALQNTFERPPVGWVPAAAIAGHTLFASLLSAPSSATTCREVATILVRVDTRTRQVTGTSTAPDCLVHMVADPIAGHAEGVVGVFQDGGWSLARFDGEGRRSGQAPLDLPANAQLVSLLADRSSAASPELLLLATTATQTLVEVRDARTLSALQLYVIDVAAPTSAVLSATTLSVLDDGIDQVLVYDRSTGLRRGFHDVRGDTSDSPMALVRTDARGSDFVVTITSRLGAVRVARPGLGRADTARPFEGFVQPYGIGPWTSDAQLWLVGLTTIFDDPAIGRDASQNVAYVTLFDPAAPRFLPGMTAIGRGPVDHVMADPDGVGSWAVLPWESRVVYVSPL